MLTRGPRRGMTGPAAAWTGTPATSRAPPGNGHRPEPARPAAAATGLSYPRLPDTSQYRGGDAPRLEHEREPPIWAEDGSSMITGRGAQIRPLCLPHIVVAGR